MPRHASDGEVVPHSAESALDGVGVGGFVAGPTWILRGRHRGGWARLLLRKKVTELFQQRYLGSNLVVLWTCTSTDPEALCCGQDSHLPPGY